MSRICVDRCVCFGRPFPELYAIAKSMQSKSATSIMPKGLLDKLTKEEILDLIAYIAAKGDAKHPLFQGGHEHGGHKH